MESQKTQNFPILRKKNETVGIILSDFTFYLLQSYSNWNSIGTKTDIEINGTGEKTWREIHTLIVNLWERRQDYIMEKSLLNKSCWENWKAKHKRIKLEHYLTPHTEINSDGVKTKRKTWYYKITRGKHR